VNDAQEINMANQQKDDSMSRSDTTAPAGAQPVQGQSEPGRTGSGIVGAAGGTDAAAGAKMGGPGNQGGAGLRHQDTDAAGSPGSPGGTTQDGRGDQLSPAAGAAVAGGTGLGEAASADDTRVGTSSGQGASPAGGDPSSGAIPPPTNKGGASAA
jgi:hypothetical protein